MRSIVLAHPLDGGPPPPFTWERLCTGWAVEPTVQHLLLMIAAPVPLGFAAPVPLGFAAPVTLALRTLPRGII